MNLLFFVAQAPDNDVYSDAPRDDPFLKVSIFNRVEYNASARGFHRKVYTTPLRGGSIERYHQGLLSKHPRDIFLRTRVLVHAKQPHNAGMVAVSTIVLGTLPMLLYDEPKRPRDGVASQDPLGGGIIGAPLMGVPSYRPNISVLPLTSVLRLKNHNALPLAWQRYLQGTTYPIKKITVK